MYLLKLIRVIEPRELTQAIVHKQAIAWHNPGIALKKFSPSNLAEINEVNYVPYLKTIAHYLFIHVGVHVINPR